MLTTMKRLAAGAALFGAAAVATAAVGQQMQFFRIGTGGTAGTYFPIGGLLANAISSPPGSRSCADGGACGVEGLIATAVASNGSVGNINAIQGGSLESGFTQSDVAFWAYTGTGVYEGKPKVENLRVIANLYPETIHLVARKGANIKSVADLKGKRVSLDEPGSGTLVDAKLILAAYGLTEKDVEAEYLKPNQAGERMRDGGMDAFFFVGGYPAGAIAELASSSGIDLVPISGPEAEKILGEYKFFAKDTVPADTYKGVGQVETISVNAQWVTSASQPDELIYGITKALWNDNTRKLLDSGHAKGKAIKTDTALQGLGVPLHAGAEKFYKEAGLLK
nr:TAXI family TRAP transporter solute-binding subunit [Agaricicola taiwanensis]